ncbi:MAG: penicillin-binding protein 1C, partial [Bacteroidia bacterium]
MHFPFQKFRRNHDHLLKQGLERIFMVASAVFIGFLLLDLTFPAPNPKSYSPEVLARDGSLLRSYLTPDDKWRMSTSLQDVPEELPKALVAKEDRWFWWHPGINPVAVLRAGFGNATSGQRESGASTITMQLARMLEPKPRTLWGKVIEAFRALQLEWHHSKSEILEMYMTHLPYGGNIEGVKAASYLYFQRPPSQLSLAQCALLTVIPNRPNSLRPDQQPAAALAARNKWLNRFGEDGIFHPKALSDALNETLPSGRWTLPVRAPQFCQWVEPGNNATALRTTLDPRLQQLAQDLLANRVRRLRPMGITNGAILIVDNRNMEVLAYCGSADFADKAAHGEVDAVQAVRSPGSALKPFIFALGFDKGQVTPQASMLDIPGEFTDFSPVNYDRDYRGEVSAEDALRNSLNLPAVRLLNKLGMSAFLRMLGRAGFATVIRQREELGLSLALGGCGVTMEELVRAYAAFAHGGELRSLRWRLGEEEHAATGRVCSPEAAFLVTEILSGIQRPDMPAEYLGRTKLPRVAWKTGTSFGRRDAWSIGYNPRFTVGVWMGNMDGKPVLEMSGAKTAVPLLLEVFNAIDFDAGKHWFPV